MARPVIALLTDFGTRDHYAGVMKGVMLGICPDATLVDISHDLPPHDMAFAAHELAAAYRFFPPATIFLVVVDPGVGTTRRGLAADLGDPPLAMAFFQKVAARPDLPPDVAKLLATVPRP